MASTIGELIFEEVKELRSELKELRVSQEKALEDLKVLADGSFGSQELLKTLVRQRMSNKLERLHETVKEKTMLDCGQVERMLGCSRPHALTLMRKLAKLPGFRFRVGTQEFHQPSVIVYDVSAAARDQDKQLLALFEKSASVTLMDIMRSFGVTIREARTLACNFVDAHPEYNLDENKIVRRNS